MAVDYTQMEATVAASIYSNFASKLDIDIIDRPDNLTEAEITYLKQCARRSTKLAKLFVENTKK